MSFMSKREKDWMINEKKKGFIKNYLCIKMTETFEMKNFTEKGRKLILF